MSVVKMVISDYKIDFQNEIVVQRLFAAANAVSEVKIYGIEKVDIVALADDHDVATTAYMPDLVAKSELVLEITGYRMGHNSNAHNVVITVPLIAVSPDIENKLRNV